MALDPKQIAKYQELANAERAANLHLDDRAGRLAVACDALIAEVQRLAKELETAKDCEDIAKDASDKAYLLMVEAQKREGFVRADCERLRGALRGILATDIGVEWDGTGGPEERAIQRARAVLPPK